MAKSKKDFSQQVGGVLGNALAAEPEVDVRVAPVPSRKFGSSSVKSLSPLTEAEAHQLAALEATIDRGMNTFLEVGRALIEIQENKLYRATHFTIEQYMLDRFSLNRNRGYQLIEAAKVVNQIAEELKPLSVEDGDTPVDSTTEGYQAVPTGKIRRSKTAPTTAKQPEDVDFTEESHSDDDSDEPSAEEPSSQQARNPNFVWSAPEEPDEEAGDKQKQSEGIKQDIPLPATESHAAALAQLPEDQRTNVWKKTVADSQNDGKPITASRIKKTAEKGGVPLNKKAPKDRKAPKNPFGNNPDPDDEFSNDALEHTRQAMDNPTWLSEETKTDNDLPDKTSVGLSDADTGQPAMDSAPVGSSQALTEALVKKIFQALPGEIMINLRGSFLIREGLSESWQALRGDDREIDEQYSDTMTIQEFWDLIGAQK